MLSATVLVAFGGTVYKGLQSVRGLPTGARMAELLDACGRRWALRVVWELRGGALNFRGLRRACGGISPGVLQKRLHEWRRFDVVERIPGLGYRLTLRGELLFQLLAPFHAWAEAGAVPPLPVPDKQH